ncbi:hypothetical protein JCM8097_005168 [Rhodosporidiobolus ruineniae]
MRFSLLTLFTLLVGLACAAELPATTAQSTASSSASSVASSSGSASASASGNNTTAAPSSSASAVVSVSQSLSVSGNTTRTLNVTVTNPASSTSTRAANLTVASVTPAGLESGITAVGPGSSASGVAVGPDDSYIAGAGKIGVQLLAGGMAAAVGVLAVF